MPIADGSVVSLQPVDAAAQPVAAAPRLLFVDNVRWTMILLVLSMHAADTYSPFGNWYYTDRPPIELGGKLFFLTWQSGLQAFFMALLFFVAGCFTPRSYDAKGAGRYLRDRLVRLGLPTLLYVFLIGPVTEFYVAHSWHTKHTFAHEMGLYVMRARFLSGTGPMWFCAALLGFSAFYALIRRIGPIGRAPLPSPVPSWKTVGLWLVGLTLTTFAVRTVLPEGTSIFNMQPADFASYILMFGAGVVANRGQWLVRIGERFSWTVAALCVGAASLTWIPLLVLGGAASGQGAAYVGGLHWQSAAKCAWEALVCVGMSFAVLAAFRSRMAGQGRLSRFLSANAFAVYVIHPPILIGVALALTHFDLPAVPKFALLWGLSAAICFGLAAPLVRRVPRLGAILN